MNETNLPSPHKLILKNISRFIDLNQEEQDLYTSFLTEKKLNKKDFLLRTGELARHEYYVVSGCLKVYNIDEKSAERVSMFAIQDWWTGDMASFLTQEPSNFYIQALEDSHILQISKEHYDLLFKRIPKFERFYRILYQRSLVTYIKRSDQNISLSAEDRYLNFTKKYPTLINRIPQKDIAAYIGVTPEFLSLLRKKLAHM